MVNKAFEDITWDLEMVIYILWTEQVINEWRMKEILKIFIHNEMISWSPNLKCKIKYNTQKKNIPQTPLLPHHWTFCVYM